MNDKQLGILINQLINAGEKLHLIKSRDKIYFTNKLMTLLGVEPNDYSYNHNDVTKLIDIIGDIYNLLPINKQEQLGLTREQAETRIINEILPAPSVIESIFNTINQTRSIKDALDWYYNFSKHTDYIKVDAIAKNKKWSSKTKYGQLEITINLSKPEKDPKEIAKAKLVANTNYPKCLLCIENEGHHGNGGNQPARHNHRMIKISLTNEEYYFQYSPYMYYDEHSIIINPQHKDMVVNSELIENFFNFVNQVPHYIIGSNTDIPIVGGSILTHDHYQAGNYVFPIEAAKTQLIFELPKYQDILIEYLYWPISTLKLTGNQQDLSSLIVQILDKWYQYDNLELDIVSSSNGERHNAITPIMRKIGEDKYVVYLLLRNNRTSELYPDGIFHPHAELHHIKKENIGLIEAMGLAILPGRLESELEQIKNILLNSDLEIAENKFLTKHVDWILELKQKYININSDEINLIIQNEIATKFVEVLEHSGVFKQNKLGYLGIKDFITTLY